MSQVSARAVFQMVASAVPPDCREHMIVVGSLAAGYHFFGRDESRQVRTKDIDCILVPRVSAVRTGRSVAERLLASGWSHLTEGRHCDPGTASTPDDDLPAVRLRPPDGGEWFIELLTVHEQGDVHAKRWTRLELPGGHFGLPSFRYLDLATYRPHDTDVGLRYARPEMMALSSLLGNQVIRPETMESPVLGRAIKRGNKDLGRAVALGRLSSQEEIERWPTAWEEALEAGYSDRWRELAMCAGAGLRSLLASDADLDQALVTSNTGLLASSQATLDQYRLTLQRLLQDAIEPLEERARAMPSGGA